MFSQLTNYISQLQNSPDSNRLGFVFTVTGTSGILLLLVWLFVLLPLQLRFINSDNNSNEEKIVSEQPTTQNTIPQVGGVINQQSVSPTSQPSQKFTDEQYALGKIKLFDNQENNDTENPSATPMPDNNNGTSDSLPVDITN